MEPWRNFRHQWEHLRWARLNRTPFERVKDAAESLGIKAGLVTCACALEALTIAAAHRIIHRITAPFRHSRSRVCAPTHYRL